MIVVKAYKGAVEFPKAYKGTQLLYEAGGNLPKEYQQVEYLQSTSNDFETNYIETGLYYTNDLTVNLDFYVDSAFGNYGRLFGIDDTQYEVLGMSDAASMYFRCYTPDGTDSHGYSFTNGTRNTLSYGNGALVVNDIQQWTYTPAVYGSNSLRLFSSHADRDGAYKMYSCQIYQGGILVRDFVPCYRKSDQEPGLYDLVNGVFYTNQGSVPFLVGGNV